MSASASARAADEMSGGRDAIAIRLALRAEQLQQPLESAPFHTSFLPGGGKFTEFYRVDGAYLLRFPGVADFSLSVSGVEAICAPAPGASSTVLEHLWLNQVRPLAQSKLGEMVFHGSCIEISGRAVAFVGESGCGKSTLAAKFASSGYRFLTDDSLLLRPAGQAYVVLPSHPSLRLWPDSRAALTGADGAEGPSMGFAPKARLPAGADLPFCDAPRPLATAYFLGDGVGDGVAFRPLTAREALLHWLRNSFLLDVEDDALVTAHFSRAAALCNAMSFYQLDYPRRFGGLDQLAAALVEHVALCHSS